MKYNKQLRGYLWVFFLFMAIILPSTIIFSIRPRFLHSCEEQGMTNLKFESIASNSSGGFTVRGKLQGQNAGRYRAEEVHIVLYSKTDVWYREPDNDLSAELHNDCSWEIEGVHFGKAYAAFLIPKDVLLPGRIEETDDTVSPLNSVNSDQIIAFTVSNNIKSSPMLFWKDDTEWQTAGQKALTWTIGQIAPNDTITTPLKGREGLIISYQIPDTHPANQYLQSRSWLYDDALAIIVLSQNGHYVEALSIISTLEQFVTNNGEIGFSFKTDDPYIDGVYQTGSIAWFGYALTQYQTITGDAQSQFTAEVLANHLLSLQATNGSVNSQPDSSIYATDQNIAAYFFLRDLGRLSGNILYTEGADKIKLSLLNNHWHNEKGYFRESIGSKEPGIIEINALGVLFLLAIDEAEMIQQALNSIDEIYGRSEVNTQTPYEMIPNMGTTFAQGTAQLALLYRRIDNDPKSESLINFLLDKQTETGGIPYVTPAVPDLEMYDWPSVAGTNWLLLTLIDDSRFLEP